MKRGICFTSILMWLAGLLAVLLGAGGQAGQ